MLDLRLRSLRHFDKAPLPSWGGDTAEIPIDDISRYVSRDLKPVEGHLASPHLDNQDPDSRTPDSRHPQPAEASCGSDEAEAVFHRNSEDLQRLGVIFCDMGTALREHPELVKPYFGKIIALDDNKFAALNTSVWSGGTFIYVPPGVQVDQPLQAYFRLSVERMGQFERTLIIADEGSKVNYIEGCSAPVYTTASLRSAVVEVVVKPSASVTHTTIQNWSSNVFNLVTKRAVVEAEGRMQWIDGNIGSRLTMQYPSIWLAGPKA
ncbi:UNVERIFIED_CONTAM: hypothetical protein GTU68_058781, partial [Idotea baltica]|nr:hypothetical protein [Idotea baltica]